MNNPRVIVDSDVFVGLFKKDDAHFNKVQKSFNELKEKNTIFYISNLVFSESITVISQKVNHEQAVSFIKFVKDQTNAELKVLRLDEDVEDLAIEIFKKQTSKNVSFVDCTNMALLESNQVDKIWSFDEIYKKNKYSTVS